MTDKFTIIDIETENAGYDIIADNARVISIQLNDGMHQEFYYADGNLSSANAKIHTMIDDGYVFVGYNVKNFDVAMLKKLLNIEIPHSQVIDIGELKRMIELKAKLGKKTMTLEDACSHFGVICDHKALLRPKIQRISKLPEVIEKAKYGAEQLVSKRNWSPNFSYNYALEKISGGMAILEYYNEFVRSGADPNSVFYRYAMGDVISEYHLYQKTKA